MKLFSGKGFSGYMLYAIGEIILVVIGILLALEINNWNEYNKERKEEQYLLSGFATDIENDVRHLNNIINDTRQRKLMVDSIYALLQKPSPEKLGDFISLQEHLMVDNYFVPNRATFDQGIASGKIQFIQNNGLRESIFEYYSYIANKRNNDHSAYHFTNEFIVPAIVEEVFSSREMITAMEGVENQLPKLDLNKIAKSPRYYQALIYARGDQYQLTDWNNYKRSAEALKDAIERELEAKK
ncbi:MAG: DUF6090 family protein [Bacteroidia bacterium]